MTAVVERLLADPTVKKGHLLEKVDRFPFFLEARCGAGPEIVVGDHTAINFGSNNYLGLTQDPDVIAANQRATKKWGTGVTGSRLMNGSLSMHRELEESLADFLQREAALVFTTGYAANIGLLTALLRPGDRVVVDAEIHASIIDGISMARARLRRFKHGSAAGAARLIRRRIACAAVVVEGMYSMRGDKIDLGPYVEMVAGSDAALIVDDAHALGTTGLGGRGVGWEHDAVTAITVTFSKSLASCGGAVVGSRPLIEALRILARPFLFTASNTPGSLAATGAALEKLRDNPEMVDQLAGASRRFRALLDEAEIPRIPGEGPIVAIPTKDDFRTLQVWRMLWNDGVFCNPVIAPAVPKGEGVLRMSVMRGHTERDLERACDALCRARSVILGPQ